MLLWTNSYFVQFSATSVKSWEDGRERSFFSCFLKVGTNEKVGMSGSWQMFGIGFGP